MHEPARLHRLAKAQKDFGRLFEARLAGERARLRRLELAKADMMVVLGRTAALGLVHYTAALRRLAELDTSMSKCSQQIGDMERKLRQAKVREQVLADRAASAEDAEQRRRSESEGQEAALHMNRRATRK